MNITFNFTQLPEIVRIHLVPRLKNYRIFTLDGPLGAGKTTLIKELLKQCTVQTTVTSPTFSYVNTYYSKNRTFYHFDLYRVDSLESFINAGFDEYLYKKNSWCLIEWPRVIDPLLQQEPLRRELCALTLHYDPSHALNRYLELLP
jgi:tRNA threonylcarbamoyladenosine biosynthesis protein TsaE